MNKLNNFTWRSFGKTILIGALMLITLPIVLNIIVFVLNLTY